MLATPPGDILRQIAKLFLILAGVSLLTACSLPRGSALTSEILGAQSQQDTSFEVVTVTRDKARQIAHWPATGWSGEYRWVASSRGPDSAIIRTGDKVDLVIWDSQENSLLVPGAAKMVSMPGITVSPAGTVFVPYLDEVVVTGMTASEARGVIQSTLSPIVPSAQVQLSVHPGKKNAVDLVSGVARPGTYPLPDRNYTILSLIAEGGGISPQLRNPLVRLIRDGKTFEIRSETLFSDGSKNTTLRGDDKILVEEDDRYFTALGATGSERLVYFQKDEITALESLSIIGGLSDARADLKGVLVLREYPASALRSDGSGPAHQQVVFSFDLTSADGLFAARNFPINPQDTVLATESAVTSVRTVFGLIGAALGMANTANNVAN